jgi:heptosyltransferase II
MKNLIIKFGASGDVVRTTTLLHLFKDVDWITSDNNAVLLKGLPNISRVIRESEINDMKLDSYDLVVNLEDDDRSARLLNKMNYKDLFGAYLNKEGKISYTDNSKGWFDLSLISRYGLERANKLKYENQKSFQELVYEGLGHSFKGEEYYLPQSPTTNLYGDIAIAPKAGKVWPMKNWAYFSELAELLRKKGLIVNFLPERSTMLEHLTDVRNHNLLISGDSLPMHFALGSGIPLITFFICTSANEIFDYGLMEKLISPDLEKYWYRRDNDTMASHSIPFSDAVAAVENIFKKRAAYV